jgi:hypothetical protein
VKKLTREQILQVIRKEVRDYDSIAAKLKEDACSRLHTSAELIEIGVCLERTLIALEALSAVMQTIRDKESKPQ